MTKERERERDMPLQRISTPTSVEWWLGGHKCHLTTAHTCEVPLLSSLGHLYRGECTWKSKELLGLIPCHNWVSGDSLPLFQFWLMDSSPSSKDTGRHQSTGFGWVTEVWKENKRDREISPWKITAIKSEKVGRRWKLRERELQTFSEWLVWAIIWTIVWVATPSSRMLQGEATWAVRIRRPW
jgi:hypothetical protein